MDANNVMSTYNMNSLWNYLSQSNSNSLSEIPKTSNLDSLIQQDYEVQDFSGKTTSSELQDIFQMTEPNYGIPLTYDSSGNIAMPANTTLPSDGLAPAEENIVSLLQSSNPTGDTMYEKVLSTYNEIENGTYKEAYSNLLSQYNLYGNENTNLIGSLLDVSV